MEDFDLFPETFIAVRVIDSGYDHVPYSVIISRNSPSLTNKLFNS